MNAKPATGRFHMLTQQRLTQAGLAGPGVQSEGPRYRSQLGQASLEPELTGQRTGSVFRVRPQLEQAGLEPDSTGLRSGSVLRVRLAEPGRHRSSDAGEGRVTRRCRPRHTGG